jgi:MFS family permease
MTRYVNGLNGTGADENRSIINRQFVLITLSGFIFFFNFHSFLLLPLRIKELGGTESDIGFIMGAASLSTIVTTPAVGILVDRWGKNGSWPWAG